LVKLPLCPLTVTVTVTAPALPVGVVAVISVALTTTMWPRRSPNVTRRFPREVCPRDRNAVPPAVEPLLAIRYSRWDNCISESCGQLPLSPPTVTVTVTAPRFPLELWP